MFKPDTIRLALTTPGPRLLSAKDRKHAAVAMILRQGKFGQDVLFIERAHHPRDPWSGNLAFPGGKINPDDLRPQGAAERETAEEIGLDLAAGRCLGQLDDITGAFLPVLVSCFVYQIDRVGRFELDPREVKDAFWFSLDELRNPQRHQVASLAWQGGERRVPAIRILEAERPVLWGITYRLLRQFFEKLNTPLPRPPELNGRAIPNRLPLSS